MRGGVLCCKQGLRAPESGGEQCTAPSGKQLWTHPNMREPPSC